MEALYAILIVLGLGALFARYFTSKYYKKTYTSKIEILESNHRRSLNEEREEKEEAIEKFRKHEIIRELEHENLKMNLEILSRKIGLRAKRSSQEQLITHSISKRVFYLSIRQHSMKYKSS